MEFQKLWLWGFKKKKIHETKILELLYIGDILEIKKIT